jgi:hypothetical protein
MKAIISLVALTTIAMAGTATARTKTVRHSFTIKQGATVQIGSYYVIHKKTCHAGPIPRIVNALDLVEAGVVARIAMELPRIT